jgi:squalene-associated FAD-dependent desaturase
VRVVVVGGGLAGLAAALELVRAGNEVTVLEARPTLGGAVQTLPERDDDPKPPPDNGQHIALGCFEEYVRFVDEIGQAGSLRRSRLSLPVIDERGHVAFIRPTATALLRYSHLSLRDRVGVLRTLLRLRRIDPPSCDRQSFASLLVRLGASESAIWRFWDVFIRPALNLSCTEASAALGVMTVQTALLSGRRASDLLLPTAPLGDMHGEAAARTLKERGARVRTNARVVQVIPGAALLADGDRVAGDAFVVALPPSESAAVLGEPDPELGKSPIVSVHLWFDRPLLRYPLAALLDSAAHWVFDRGELTGHPPERGQYLTVVSSGDPNLMDVRGRELVDLMRDELTARLGDARLLWSRVSREPAATFAGRPGTAARRPGQRTSRINVARAGAWTDTGWPATMESAVRSGRAAARVLSDVATKVAA